MSASAHELHRAVERAVRESWSRLVAYLAMRTRDVAAAEDALSDALQSALETWPRDGIPDKPEAWLLTAARRKLIDRARHHQVQSEALPTLILITDEAQELAEGANLFPDERLKLLFICAHPAIDAAARTPLMLQTVLGLDAARIASAFIVKPSAMSQRLTRAKTKIRDAGIAFEIPEARELPARLDAVLQAIYAAYGSGWDDVAGADERRKGLALEAIELGRLLRRLLPDEPEVIGLLALMLYCESRREARRGPAGEYIPLSEQNTALWSAELIDEANHLLADAERIWHIGRFQFEAAIQAVHAQRLHTGRTDWNDLVLLYDGLVRISPTIGALVSRAAAIAEAHGAHEAWAQLQAIPESHIHSYQAYWALAAHLLRQLGRHEEAAKAYAQAIGLCEDPAMRSFLLRKSKEIAS